MKYHSPILEELVSDFSKVIIPLTLISGSLIAGFTLIRNLQKVHLKIYENNFNIPSKYSNDLYKLIYSKKFEKYDDNDRHVLLNIKMILIENNKLKEFISFLKNGIRLVDRDGEKVLEINFDDKINKKATDNARYIVKYLSEPLYLYK